MTFEIPNFLTEQQKAALEHIKELHKEGKTGRNADYVAPRTYERIFNSLGNMKGAKVIDVGSGPVTGDPAYSNFFIPLLEGKGVTLIPVDAVHKFTKTWNIARNPSKEIEVAPVTANALELPFADESIDGCISANLINLHWFSGNIDSHGVALFLLQEFSRVIQRKGFVIISSLGYNKSTHLNGSVTYNNDIPEQQMLTPAEIKQMGFYAGFSEVSEIPLDEQRLSNNVKFMTKDKPKDVSRVEIVNACAFLMKK